MKGQQEDDNGVSNFLGLNRNYLITLQLITGRHLIELLKSSLVTWGVSCGKKASLLLQLFLLLLYM